MSEQKELKPVDPTRQPIWHALLPGNVLTAGAADLIRLDWFFRAHQGQWIQNDEYLNLPDSMRALFDDTPGLIDTLPPEE